MSKLSDAVSAIATLVAYWPMQETSGTTIDDVESTNDLTLIAGTLAATGLVPNTTTAVSISFDGTDDYLRQPLPAAFKIDPITTMFLFRVPTSWATGNRCLLQLAPRQAAGVGKGIDILLNLTANLVTVRKGNGTAFVNAVGDTILAEDTTYIMFAEAGTTGVKQWLRTVTLDPPDSEVYENTPFNANTDAIDWTDGAAGNYPDPAQMYVSAFRSNAAAADDIVANSFFAKTLMSDLAIFDGTLTSTQRTTIFEAAVLSIAESWAHPSTARSLSVASLTADDPLDLVESGHKE